MQEILEVCSAVTIATPAESHFEIAIRALEKNCHVFIEKPITTNLPDAEKIIALAKQKKLLVQVGHIERFNPAFVQLLQKPNINSVKFIESERLAPFNVRGLDVDVVLDLMIHDIDLILQLKRCDVKNIEALGVNVLSDTIDLANARIVFEDNSVANLTASRISDTAIRKLRVFNNQQYISIDLQQPTINTYAVKKQLSSDNATKMIFSSNNKFIVHQKENVLQQNALYEELVSFITSIQKKQETLVDACAGRDAIKIALAIQEKINE